MRTCPPVISSCNLSAAHHRYFLNLPFDIFRARFCLIGHIEFDLAVLKYFDLDKIQFNLNIFDGLYDKIVQSIDESLLKIREWLSKLSFNPLDIIIAVLSQLGGLIQPLVDKIANVHQKLLVLPGAILRKVQDDIERVLGFFENAIQTLLEFQRRALLWLTEKVQAALNNIGRAVQLVLDALGWLFKAPLRAIQALANSISALVKAAHEIFEAMKQFFRDTLSFFLGMPSWLDFPKISTNVISLQDIRDFLYSIVNTLNDSASAFVRTLIEAIEYVC